MVINKVFNMETLVANINGQSRRETFNGRDYVVVPMVTIVPGVLNGSQGALYYPPEEVSKNPGLWNHTPITLGHPLDDDGVPTSARIPEVLNRVQLGYVFNDHWDGQRRVAEGWFDEQLTRQRAPKVYEQITQNKLGELSTGLKTDNYLAANGSADPKGRRYTHVAKNYLPDHLAALPEARGACSVADGCGINVNESTENAFCPTGKGGGQDNSCGVNITSGGQIKDKQGTKYLVKGSDAEPGKPHYYTGASGEKYVKAYKIDAHGVSTKDQLVKLDDITTNTSHDHSCCDGKTHEESCDSCKKHKKEEVANAFCPTGKGGGQDNSCGGGKEGTSSKGKPTKVFPKLDRGGYTARIHFRDEARGERHFDSSWGVFKVQPGEFTLYSKMSGDRPTDTKASTSIGKDLKVGDQIQVLPTKWTMRGRKDLPGKTVEITGVHHQEDGSVRITHNSAALFNREETHSDRCLDCGWVTCNCGGPGGKPGPCPTVATGTSDRTLLDLSAKAQMAKDPKTKSKLHRRLVEEHGKHSELLKISSPSEAKKHSAAAEHHKSLAANAFCPTGKGGGQDNSCGGKEAGGKSEGGDDKPRLGAIYGQYKVKAMRSAVKKLGGSAKDWHPMTTEADLVKTGRMTVAHDKYGSHTIQFKVGKTVHGESIWGQDHEEVTTNRNSIEEPIMTKNEAITYLTTNCSCWKDKEKVLNGMDDEFIKDQVKQAKESETLNSLREDLEIPDDVALDATKLSAHLVANAAKVAEVTDEEEDAEDEDMEEEEETEDVAPPPYFQKKKKGPPMPPTANFADFLKLPAEQRLTANELEAIEFANRIKNDVRRQLVTNIVNVLGKTPEKKKILSERYGKMTVNALREKWEELEEAGLTRPQVQTTNQSEVDTLLDFSGMGGGIVANRGYSDHDRLAIADGEDLLAGVNTYDDK